MPSIFGEPNKRLNQVVASLPLVSRSVVLRALILALALALSGLACEGDQQVASPPSASGIHFSRSEYYTDEAAGTCFVTIVRPSEYRFAYVELQAIPITATPNVDYERPFLIDPGFEPLEYQVGILEDSDQEETESLLLVLTNPDSGTCISEPHVATLYIIEDDNLGPAGPIHFPLVQGSTWHYTTRSSFSGEGTWSGASWSELALTATGLAAFEGTEYTVLDESGPAQFGWPLLRQEGQKVLGFYAPDSEAVPPGDCREQVHASIPWTFFDFDAPTGGVWVPYSIDSLNTEGGCALLDRTTFRALGRCNVTVPGGFYMDAACFRMQHEKVRPEISYVESTCDFYVADGAGIVKLVEHGTGWAGPGLGYSSTVYYWLSDRSGTAGESTCR